MKKQSAKPFTTVPKSSSFGVERVRIFIVAAEISPELTAAASEVSDVLLFAYTLTVKVTKLK
jgi:hypothetical protein